MDTVSMLKVLVLLVCVFRTEGRSFIRLCYFPSWAYGRASPYTRFDVPDIDPTLCTHLVYAFATVDVDSRRLVPMDPNDNPQPGDVGRHKRFNDLKKNYPHLKTLVSVGGQYAGNEQFAAIAKHEHYLQTFVQTTVEFLRQRNFDGLDIDWEYPNATTKTDFTKFLKALRTAFDADKTGEKRLLLTVALPAGRQYIDTGYDIGALNRYVDLASIMTYDYHGSWSSMTSFDSPLFSRKSDPNFNLELSTKWTVDYYMDKGLQADKVLVGITAAGTHFQLQNISLNGVGAPVVKSSTPRLSDLWQLPDRYAYPEVDWMLTKGVAGAMFWALDMDDFTGKVCDKGKYPLLRALSHRVGQVENTHLTDNVNPSIRYLTKYTGGGCPGLYGGGGGGVWAFSVLLAVSAFVVFLS